MMVNKVDRQDKIWIGRRFSDSLVDCVSPQQLELNLSHQTSAAASQE